MAKDIKRYISSCDTCQRNKGNNEQPVGLLQPLETPQHHWKQIVMDFIVQLSLTRQEHDAIVVFTDHFTKRDHFQAMHTSVTIPEITKIFFNTIFKDHGLPKTIISDYDAKFTSNF